MSIALYLAVLFGLMVCAGYIGGLTARYKAPSVEKRTEPPWSAYERAILVENIGFLSGAWVAVSCFSFHSLSGGWVDFISSCES
jgi:hypothetical protein